MNSLACQLFLLTFSSVCWTDPHLCLTIMTENFPDIEIYVKQVKPAAIENWLRQHFDIVRHESKDHSHRLTLSSDDDTTIECLMVENAVKGFTSIWFKSADTPWQTDRDCALDAATALDCEVRCSTGPWHEGSEDQGAWLQITDQGESRINWFQSSS